MVIMAAESRSMLILYILLQSDMTLERAQILICMTECGFRQTSACHNTYYLDIDESSHIEVYIGSPVGIFVWVVSTSITLCICGGPWQSGGVKLEDPLQFSSTDQWRQWAADAAKTRYMYGQSLPELGF